jgi:predicted nucleotidyltransferase component of viral defense system
MTQDEMIELAKQAGMIQDGEVWFSHSYENCDVYTVELLFFAKLVAEKEREACAKLCDVLAVHPEYASEVTKLAALAIRARGQA